LLREGRVTANGLRFAYLEGGGGPLVVLLHGWPDTPHTWDYQLAALAGAGFRVAAPWLRGYPPTEIPRSGYFDIGTLAQDVRELIQVLGGGDPCLLVGQDWGASIGDQVLAAFPEVVRSAVVMAVPHPAATRESLLRAEHVHRSFHWFFFQLPQLPERALSADNYAFVDWLWDYWTVPGFTDEEHLAEVRRMLAVPGALEPSLSAGCFLVEYMLKHAAMHLPGTVTGSKTGAWTCAAPGVSVAGVAAASGYWCDCRSGSPLRKRLRELGRAQASPAHERPAQARQACARRGIARWYSLGQA